MIKDKR